MNGIGRSPPPSWCREDRGRITAHEAYELREQRRRNLSHAGRKRRRLEELVELAEFDTEQDAKGGVAPHTTAITATIVVLNEVEHVIDGCGYTDPHPQL